MNYANLSAIENLDRLFSAFSTQREDGATFPRSFREVSIGKTFFAKAKEAQPDSLEIRARIEYAESLLDQSLQKRWAGSFWLLGIFFFLFVFLSYFVTQNIRESSDWPSPSEMVLALEEEIRQVEASISQLQQNPNPTPIYVGEAESPQKFLEELRQTDLYRRWRSEFKAQLQTTATKLFILFYSLTILVAYYYTSKAPGFLVVQRQMRAKTVGSIDRTGGFLFKLFCFFSAPFFIIAAFFFKMFASVRTVTVTKNQFGHEVDRETQLAPELILIAIVPLIMYAGLMYLLFGFILNVFLFFLRFAWIIILFQYLKNYRYEWLEASDRKLKKKLKLMVSNWKEKNKAKAEKQVRTA